MNAIKSPPSIDPDEDLLGILDRLPERFLPTRHLLATFLFKFDRLTEKAVVEVDIVSRDPSVQAVDDGAASIVLSSRGAPVGRFGDDEVDDCHETLTGVKIVQQSAFDGLLKQNAGLTNIPHSE
jgi:hypothetical protein